MNRPCSPQVTEWLSAAGKFSRMTSKSYGRNYCRQGKFVHPGPDREKQNQDFPFGLTPLSAVERGEDDLAPVLLSYFREGK